MVTRAAWRYWAALANDPVLVTVLVFAAVVRLLWAQVLPMHRMGDSADYLELAHRLAHLHLSGYDGARTPGYPLVLVLVGSNTFWIGFVQGVLGVVGTGFAYAIIRRATGNRAAAAVGAVLSTLSMAQLIEERTVLTEFFTGFLLLLLVLLLQRVPDEGAPRSDWYRWSAGVGLVMAYSALTRPSFVAVLPAVALYVWGLRRRFAPATRPAGLAVWALVLLPTVVGYASWVAFNATENHWATISTNQGQGLTNATCRITVPAENRSEGIIDLIYLPYRDQYRIEMNGTCAGAATPAFARIQRVTGWSQLETEKQLSARGIRIIERRPMDYAQQTLVHLTGEWRGTVPKDPHLFRHPLRGAIYSVVRVSQVVISRLVRYGFLVMAVVGLILAVVRRRRPDPFFTVVVTMVLLTSIANILFESDRLPELLDPFQPVIITMLVAGIARAVIRHRPTRDPDRGVGPGAWSPPVA
jgi:hypothetical protein